MPEPAPEEDLAQIDRALIGLRHLWSAPARISDPALGQVDLSTVWIVEVLTGKPESGLTIGELALGLGVAHSTACRLVDRAEKAGAVKRRPGRSDARKVAISVTEQGGELAATARAHRRQQLAGLTADWSAAERATFAELLTRLTRAVNNTGR